MISGQLELYDTILPLMMTPIAATSTYASEYRDVNNIVFANQHCDWTFFFPLDFAAD